MNKIKLIMSIVLVALAVLIIFIMFFVKPQCFKQKEAFITTWAIVSPNDSLTIPTHGGNKITDYSFEIDWGDGSPSENFTGDDPDPFHVYKSADTFAVHITGIFPRILFSPNETAKKLLSIEQWGDIAWESMDSSFFGAINMVINATDAPDLSKVKSMAYMFASADGVTGDLSKWDVSNVTNMSSMFEYAISFNSDLSKWNVSNVTDMSSIFEYAASFNSDLSEWDVSNVTNMASTFNGARAFNGDISTWNVSKVTNMSFMFAGAKVFNGDLCEWDVSSVTGMNYMFESSIAFDKDLNKWDVSNVMSMVGMFAYAELFNGDISKWDVSSVTNMSSMFWDAYEFNHDLSQWDVSNVRNLRGFLTRSCLSTQHYDQMLINWNKLHIQDNVKFGAKGISFDLGFAARQQIIANHCWTFNDGGQRVYQ